MSVKITSHVWEHSQQSGTHLLMLLAIADHANDDGIAWPSVNRLAHKARIKERQARRIIADLVNAGEIAILKPGSGRTTHLIQVLGGSWETSVNLPIVELAMSRKTPQRGHTDPPRGVIAMTPESSLTITEPSISSSEAPARAPASETGDAAAQEEPSPLTAEARQALESALLEVTQQNPASSPGGWKGWGATVNRYLKAKMTPADVYHIWAWWQVIPYRGRQGERPDIWEVGRRWGEARAMSPEVLAEKRKSLAPAQARVYYPLNTINPDKERCDEIMRQGDENRAYWAALTPEQRAAERRAIKEQALQVVAAEREERERERRQQEAEREAAIKRFIRLQNPGGAGGGTGAAGSDTP